MLPETPGVAFPNELAALQVALDEAAEHLGIAKGSHRYDELAHSTIQLFEAGVSGDLRELVSRLVHRAEGRS